MEEKMKNNEKDIPIWYKRLLTLEEASKVYNIGVNKLRDISNEKNCDFVLFSGNRRLIKVPAFERFLAGAYSI